MLLYILYNADLLKIPTNTANEDAIGYVDNTTLLAIAKNFEGTMKILKEMMTREEGGLQWSNDHNSRFEVYKSAIAHFSRKMIPDPNSNNRQIPLPRPVLIWQPDNTRSQQLQVSRYTDQLSTQMERTGTKSDSKCN